MPSVAVVVQYVLVIPGTVRHALLRNIIHGCSGESGIEKLYFLLLQAQPGGRFVVLIFTAVVRIVS